MRLITKISLVTLAVVGLGLAATAGFTIAHYRNRVLPNTRVGGELASGFPKAALQEKVAAQSAAYSKHTYNVQFSNQDKPSDVAITASELGVQFGSQTAVDQAWAYGHTGSIFQRVSDLAQAFWSGKSIPITYSVDQETFMSGLVRLVDPLMIQPKPAQLSVNGEEVIITDAVEGFSYASEGFHSKLRAALSLSSDESPTTIMVEAIPTQSPITREVLAPLSTQLSALGDSSLTLSAGGNTVKPSRKDKLAWYSVVQDENTRVNLVVNEEAIATYLKTQKAYFDADKSLPILVAQARSDSIKIADTSTKLSAITLNVVAKAVVAPKEITAGSYTLNLYDTKYIQVNLAEQKLYAIDGGTLVKVYKISSGKWATPTPKGTFTISSKYPRAYSRTFGLYMPYWMNFVGAPDDGSGELPLGAYGLHELPEWPNGYKEGQAHLGTAVSHGCVRLGVGDAAEVYAWTSVGTHVVIH